ncbi:hypothetical protein I6F26_24345 [Ensifer sp. IC3342]|nr:hypothetical protein [Ensifer sp. BRP08]MCA1449706.1 hypothetical protein [Ensifer sp. IC3342]
MNDALSEREIVSESNLHKALISNLGSFCTLEARPAINIGPQDVEQVVGAWRAGMDRQASRLARSAINTLAALPVGCLYESLGDKSWQAAAQICEVFRNSQVSKNAGRLDTRALQRKVHEALARDEHLNLVLGWGQPKRSAGGLKTLGSFADLAEMYAIRRLLIIVRAVSQLVRRPVGMIVLTGSSRFFEALFTRPNVGQAYDAQRQMIADALGRKGTLSFRPYSDLFGDGSHSVVIDAREQRFRDSLAVVTDEMILSKFETVLLNIDWEHLFALDPMQRHHAPHGIQLPPSIEAWLRGRDETACSRLIRAAIVSLISPERQSDWIASFEGEDVFEVALSFVQSVAWESTRKYIALHLIDSSDEATSILNAAQGANVLRLTVHQKRDRRDVPAIFTLGPGGGNLLAQHVLACVLKRDAIVFESYAELQQRDAAAVYLRPVSNQTVYPLFGWLAPAQQPLCFVEVGCDTLKLLCEAGGVQ